MDVAPALPLPREEVAKASQGHDPLPFLISELKNWCKGNSAKLRFQIAHEKCKTKKPPTLTGGGFQILFIFFPGFCLPACRPCIHHRLRHHPAENSRGDN